MKITPKGYSNIKNVDFNNLKFGANFSDHMLICVHKNGSYDWVYKDGYEFYNFDVQLHFDNNYYPSG